MWARGRASCCGNRRAADRADSRGRPRSRLPARWLPHYACAVAEPPPLPPKISSEIAGRALVCNRPGPRRAWQKKHFGKEPPLLNAGEGSQKVSIVKIVVV